MHCIVVQVFDVVLVLAVMTIAQQFCLVANTALADIPSLAVKPSSHWLARIYICSMGIAPSLGVSGNSHV